MSRDDFHGTVRIPNVIHCLRGRVLKPELLDSLPEDQARASLADLVRINRDWGGHSTLRRLLAQLVRRDEAFSLLDVGAASGDMADCVRADYPGARVTSLDYRLSHLRENSGPSVVGDAFALPFRDASFDFVFCSLFLHHFTNLQITELLAGFGRVARRGVLAIDLERNPIAYWFLPGTRWLLGWDPVTVHDGKISVEAAFRAHELEGLSQAAGLRDARAKAYWPAFRVALWARSPGV
jgi:2-polyprenyl-3-methyl-5-hydroxy-6-metoxy-1,4-benzoquinol methylase